MLESIESGKVKIKVLSTNETSITLLTNDKFQGKVVQPEATANRVTGEHGLAMSIEVKDNNVSHLFLLDTGGLNQTIIENSKQLGVNLNNVEKLILSHGHFDHFGGLTGVIPLLKEGSELILNPTCFEQNYIVMTKSGEEIAAEELGGKLKELEKEGKLKMNRKLPLLSKDLVTKTVNQYKIKLVETNKPINLYKGITTSGEIELFDPDEITKGLYIQKSRKDFEKHTFRDETSLYINVKDKGLAVLTGCGHTGIINTIKYGQKLAGTNKIYAIIGGFHEEWNTPESIEKKVKYFEQLSPEIICGMHCTGFDFNRTMSRNRAHTIGVVGTEFLL